jgi:uncharacterized membrane protein
MFGIALHRLIIHFPIALMIVAAIYDSWAVYSKRPQLHEVGYGLTLWAAVSALAAVVTGLQLAGVTRIDQGVVTGHAGYGIASGIAITALGVARYSARARQRSGYRMPWLVLGLAGAVLVVVAAITGHRL